MHHGPCIAGFLVKKRVNQSVSKSNKIERQITEHLLFIENVKDVKVSIKEILRN